MNKLLYLSATSIGDFKSCPTRYMLHYVYGIVPAEEKDSLRIGTNWHRVLEIAGMEPGGECECIILPGKTPNPNCPLCKGIGKLPDDIMDAVMRELDERYTVSTCPASKSLSDWQIEKITLLYSLSGYLWYWQNNTQKVIMPEVPFSLPLVNPANNQEEPDVVLKGKIDKIIKRDNSCALVEHKSTSKQIDASSDYWGHLSLDTQTMLYVYVARKLQRDGVVKSTGASLINKVFYDVWHKPQIAPKKLSQADTKKFFKDKTYCGRKFSIGGDICQDNHWYVMVDDERAEAFPGAKEGTFAIRETPEMFGTRLLEDITQRPEFYFACKELERDADEIKEFEHELFNVYLTIKNMRGTNCWFKNERQCEATFKCPYVNICYNHLIKDVIAGSVPLGYKQLFKKGK